MYNRLTFSDLHSTLAEADCIVLKKFTDSGLLQTFEGDWIATRVCLPCEGGDADAVLIHDFHLHGRDAMVVAGEVSFGPERIPLSCGDMVVNGRVNGESKVFVLIHQRGEYKVREREDCSALADISGVEMCRCHFHHGDGGSWSDLDEPDTAPGREMVVGIEIIL